MEFKIPLVHPHMTVELLFIMYNGIQCTEGVSGETRQHLLQFVVEEYAKLHGITPKSAAKKLKEDAEFVHEANVRRKSSPAKAPKVLSLKAQENNLTPCWVVSTYDRRVKDEDIYQEKLYLSDSDGLINWGLLSKANLCFSHDSAIELLAKNVGNRLAKIERFYTKKVDG